MLSILIPIYNCQCSKLVNDLHEQGVLNNIDFEIVCLDDKSDQEYIEANKNLGELEHVVYELLEENIGRARIRNLLAAKAKYNSLLFIDCDMAVDTDDFLTRYIEGIDGPGAVIGGVAYELVVPNPEYILRWTYGRERESNSMEIRAKRPYASFMTGVFLIDKSSFDAIKFDESITRYGHEDTLFGAELKQQGIAVKHINNPLIHQGLEVNSAFVSKTEEAIQTLAELVQSGKIRNDVKLYRVYKTLKAFYLTGLFANRFKARKERWLENLYSSNPDLKYFDMYRLGYLCTLL